MSRTIHPCTQFSGFVTANNLLRQYAQMRKMFKTMGSGGGLKAQQRMMSQMQGRQKFGR